MEKGWREGGFSFIADIMDKEKRKNIDEIEEKGK